MVRWLVAAFLAAELLCASAAYAQSEADAAPVRGSRELQLWISQSHALAYLSGGRNSNLFQVGIRYGWVLTAPHGPGPLRGQFEYAPEFIPLILPFQSSGTTYGIGLNPVSLKWIFERHGRFVPYLDGTAGGMVSHGRVPPQGSNFNFMASGGLGVHILRGRYMWSVDTRVFHISDAFIVARDPTYNMIQVRVGFGLFRPPK